MAMKRTREDDPMRWNENGGETKISEMEMEAAQQLMPLSDEEILSSGCSHSRSGGRNNGCTVTLEEITSRKINETFGHDHDHKNTGLERERRKATKTGAEGKNKVKKYRTIQSIYMETRPLRVVYANKGLS